MTPPVTVFDCMVYLQAAARAEGPGRACLRLAEEGRILLCISPPVHAEVANVLNRPQVRRKFAALTPEAVTVFLEDVSRLARSVPQVPSVVTFPRDPKDEPYLNLALAAGAEYLVTWDKDLLDLMNESTVEGKAFRQRFPQLTCLTPVAFLQVIREKEKASGQAGADGGPLAG